MTYHERLNDLPEWLKIGLTLFNRVGFPVLVCAWLAYQQFSQGRDIAKAMQDFKEVMIQMKDTLDQQNRILRHRGKDD